MLRIPLAYQLAALFGVMWVVAIGFSLLVGSRLHKELAERSVTERLLVELRILSTNELLRQPLTESVKKIASAAWHTGDRLILLDGGGTVLYDSRGDAALAANRLDDPAVRVAARSGNGARPIFEDGQTRWLVALRLPSPRTESDRTNEPPRGLGFLLAEGTADTIASAKVTWNSWTYPLALVTGIGGLALCLFAGDRLQRQLGALTRRARAIAKEDYSALGDANPAGPAAPIAVLDAKDPLAPLAKAIEELRDTLQSRSGSFENTNRALVETSRQLETILSGMAEGVLAIDADERFLYANPAAVTLLDLPRGALRGRPVWEVLRQPGIHATLRDALVKPNPGTVEIELPRTQSVLALRASRFAGDPCPGVVLVLHDMTELRRLENLRREFVSNVSHELKTPIASIQAYTDTLLEGAIDDPDHNTVFLQRISEQTDRLHHLILDMLRLARIEAGRDVFEIRRLSAAKIIVPCVEEHTAVARARKITLSSEPPLEPVRLRADPDGLRTILDNLLDNAVNYTPAGGRVTVRWRLEGETTVIEVADTGLGIPPEHRDRIFERFHRVDEARSREHGGTGLGLAIVKHLVQVFEGRIEVESELNVGSVFRVFLPTA